MSLLAGCGMQGGDTNNNDSNTDESKEITLEQVRVDNIPEKLLEDHEAVTVSIQGTDQDGRETYTARCSTRAMIRGTCCWPRTTATPPTAPWARMNSSLSLPVDRGKRRVSQQNGKRRPPEYELLSERRV